MITKKKFFLLVVMGTILFCSYNTVTLLASSSAILRPNGPGSLTQLGVYGNQSNWQSVADVVPDDGGYYDGGSYVHKYGSGYLWDLYALSDFAGSGPISKITIYFRCDYEWGEGGWAIPVIRTGGNNYYGSEVTLQDEWTTFSYTWNNNPCTGVAWTAADLNQLEAGIGLYGGNNDEARCTQVYVEVDYIPWNYSTLVLRPNGQGSLTQLGAYGNQSNWQLVDEVIPDDGGYYCGGTYVHKYGSGYLWDLYALSDFTGSVPINNITVCFRCDYEWGVGGWAIPVIRAGGNNYLGSEVTFQDAWTTFSYTWNNNPCTGVAWTSADLNQLEAGVGLYGGSDDEVRCTQLYVLVNYNVNIESQPQCPIGLLAMPTGNGQIYLGWRLSNQNENIGYNIYRSLSEGTGYTKINVQPITNSTNYIDSTVTNGTTYYYYIKTVDTNGFESGNSQIVSVTASTEVSNKYMFCNNFAPNPNSDDYGDIKVGDVDNDGFNEFLVAAADTITAAVGNTCSQSNSSLYAPIKVMLFDHYKENGDNGKLLWGPINTYVSWRGEFPWTLCDVNGDGKDEIIGIKFDYDNSSGNVLDVLRLVVMDNTGAILSQSNNVPHQFGPYYNGPGHGNRIYITIAYLNGTTPNIIVNCGIYKNDINEILAYNPDCSLLWRYTYPANDPLGGGAHMIRAADINLDGRDDVLHGTSVFSGTYPGGNPTPLWSKGWGHMDFLDPKDIRPDIPGLEILIGCEDSGGDLELLDKDGNQIWYYYKSGYHAQLGWAANMTNQYPGLECYVIFDDDYNTNRPYYLFDSTGQTTIENGTRTKPEFSQPIDWDGDNVMEKHDYVINNLLNPPIPVSGGIPILQNMYAFIADVIGDYREELIIFIGGSGNQALTGQFYIYTNTTLNTQRKKSPWTNRLYSESKRYTGYRD